MKMRWAALLPALVLVAFVGTAFWLSGARAPQHPEQGFAGLQWERLVSPGKLTDAHAFLENRCTACHEPISGVTRTNCVVCHANETSLLQRQPTAFHADVDTCVPCHVEHDGQAKLVPPMNHHAMAELGIATLMEDPAPDGEGRLLAHKLRYWMTQTESLGGANRRLSVAEWTLNCETCHRNDDRHFDMFGGSCSDCHSTTSWTLPEFRHPSSASRDCSQCHQAPPSHYMGHFRMISQRVAGRPDARVDQCFACHQTTSWTDIQRVGMYKHH